MNKYNLTLILYASAFLLLAARGYTYYVTITAVPLAIVPIEIWALAVGEIGGLVLLFIFLDRLLDSTGE